MEEEGPMEKSRRHYSPEQKVAILREHLVEQMPVSEVCEKHQIHPTVFYQWQERYGKANEHNGLVPRDHWLEEWEKKAIIEFHHQYPLEGYRRLTFMLLDREIVAVSPASTYRVLSKAGLLQRWNTKPSRKGTGFVQPLQPQEHWHVDISYLNVAGTFFYLCSILDGCSRFLLHWELRTAMTELDVEIVLQRARESYPGTSPRIITDNGPQFIAKDFKAFIRLAGLTHVKTSPYYPQSNGKIERWHQCLKPDCLRLGCPLSQHDAARLIERFVNQYNTVRLHSAIGYVTPAARLAGRHLEIFSERDRKLELARQNRKTKRQSLTKSITASTS